MTSQAGSVHARKAACKGWLSSANLLSLLPLPPPLRLLLPPSSMQRCTRLPVPALPPVGFGALCAAVPHRSAGTAGVRGAWKVAAGSVKACLTMKCAGIQEAWLSLALGLHHAQAHHMGRSKRPIPSNPARLQRLAPVPSPAAGRPSHSKLAQRR